MSAVSCWRPRLMAATIVIVVAFSVVLASTSMTSAPVGELYHPFLTNNVLTADVSFASTSLFSGAMEMSVLQHRSNAQNAFMQVE